MVIFCGNEERLEDCFKYCISKKILGFDIETTRGDAKENQNYKAGLDPRLSKVVMIQIGDLERQFIIDARNFSKKRIRQFLQPILENENILIIGHNLQFEGMFMLEHYYVRMINVWDTMLCENVLYNGFQHRYSLEALMQRYFGIKSVHTIDLFNVETLVNEKIRQKEERNFLLGIQEDIDDVMDSFVDKSTRLEFLNIKSKPFTDKQIKYGADDIKYPIRIYNKQIKGRLIGSEQWIPLKAFQIENRLTQVLAEMTWRGVPFSTELWNKTNEKQEEIFNKRLKTLNDYVISQFPSFVGSYDIFTGHPSCAIQWSSSKQVISLFKKLGLAKREKSKYTGKVEWTVGAKTLFRHLPNKLKVSFYKNKDVEITNSDELCLQYLLYKKSEQLVTTFGQEFLKYVHPVTGRIHPSFRQYMISGRLSSNSPNGQNLPNSKAFRTPFYCDEGWSWLSSDYAGQELRIAAEVHNVPKMIDFFVKGDPYFGEDYHSFAATQMQRILRNDPEYIVPPKEIDGKDNPDFNHEHNENRTQSKALSFKSFYGASGYTIFLDLGLESPKVGDAYLQTFLDGLPGLEDSFNKKKKLAKHKGWITISEFSDKRYFYPEFKEMISLVDEAYSYTDYAKGERIPEEEKIRLRNETPWTSIWSKYGSLKGKLERRSLNLPIQGAAADMLKISLIMIYDERWKRNIQEDFFVCLPVHDENNSCAKSEIQEIAKEIQEQCMLKAGSFICKKIEMGVSTAVGDFWIH